MSASGAAVRCVMKTELMTDLWTTLCGAWLVLIILGFGLHAFVPRAIIDTAIVMSGVAIHVAFKAGPRYGRDAYFISFFAQWILIYATGRWWLSGRAKLSPLFRGIIPVLVVAFFIATVVLNYKIGFK